MPSIDFPFAIKNGKVVTTDNDIDAKVKRVIQYSTTDIPYTEGIGAGITDIVFSVGVGGHTWKIIEDNIITAMMKIPGMERVEVSFQKEKAILYIYVYYVHCGTSSSYHFGIGE
jgi:chorismate synthase